MSQTGKIFAVLVFAFIVYTTAKGNLIKYARAVGI